MPLSEISHLLCCTIPPKHPGVTALGTCCLLQIPDAYTLLLETC